MNKKQSLTSLVLSSLFFVAPSLSLAAIAQDTDPDSETLIAQASLVCQNYSAEAAREEAFLLALIEESERSQNPGGGINIREVITVLGRFLPQGGNQVGEMVGLLERALQVLGKEDVLEQQGSGTSQVTNVISSMGERLTPLIAKAKGGNLDPMEAMTLLMETATEIGNDIEAQQPPPDPQLQMLYSQLESLQNQCRNGQPISRTPNTAQPSQPSNNAPVSGLPSVEQSGVNSEYASACNREGGAISSYYEGEPVSAEDDRLQRKRAVESPVFCLAGMKTRMGF